MERIKVFISDPQVLFREGIHFILSGEEDFEVTGETTSNEEALSRIVVNPPHIAILSMYDTKTSGATVTSNIRRNMPSVFVILIMDKKEPDKVFSAIKSGASACLTKDTDPDLLLNTIKIVAQGSLPSVDELYSPAIASLVLTEFEDSLALNEQFDNVLATLTPKEKQTLNLIASGSKIEQITINTDMNEDATRYTVRTILNKLVANEQTRNTIEVTQRNMPLLIRSGKMNAKANDYVTKAEFNNFRDNLMERFNELISGLTSQGKSKK